VYTERRNATGTGRRGRSYNFNPIVGNRDLERDLKNALADSGLEVYDLYSFYPQPEIDCEINCKYVFIIGDDPEWNRMVEHVPGPTPAISRRAHSQVSGSLRDCESGAATRVARCTCVWSGDTPERRSPTL
jgi:hypothetical protein